MSLVSPKQPPWISWVSNSLPESHESPLVSLSLMSLHEFDSQETHESTVVFLSLMRPQQSAWVSWVPISLPESHECPLFSLSLTSLQ